IVRVNEVPDSYGHVRVIARSTSTSNTALQSSEISSLMMRPDSDTTSS
ncbi:MAG: hypothetical protein RLZZ43_523, partial [Actinomycetota bacterium]